MPETHLRPTAASGGRQRSVFSQPNRTIDTNFGYCEIDSITGTLELFHQRSRDRKSFFSHRVVIARPKANVNVAEQALQWPGP